MESSSSLWRNGYDFAHTQPLDPFFTPSQDPFNVWERALAAGVLWEDPLAVEYPDHYQVLDAPQWMKNKVNVISPSTEVASEASTISMVSTLSRLSTARKNSTMESARKADRLRGKTLPQGKGVTKRSNIKTFRSTYHRKEIDLGSAS